MSTGIEFMHLAIIAISLLLGSLNVQSLPCEYSRCKTGSCNSNGGCICNLPEPSTILDGDRPFLGGKFCDEEMTMCDGTNSFWCENGGICEEIVQGEDYLCKCPPGYIGEHCQHPGVLCGRRFCFHEAECLAESGVCQCQPDWRGSFDCSLPTQNRTDSSMNSTMSSQFPHWGSSDGSTSWVVVVVAISFSIGAVAGGAIYVKKFFGKKETAPKFQQLSRMQSHSIMDDDEADTMVSETSRNGLQRL